MDGAWTGCEEGFQDPSLVEVEDVVGRLASVPADEEGADDVVVTRGEVGEDGCEDFVL